MTPAQVRVMVQRAIEVAASGVEKLADDVGVSYGTVWSWARGKRNPTEVNMRKLAKVLRRRAAKLLELAERLERGG